MVMLETPVHLTRQDKTDNSHHKVVTNIYNTVKRESVHMIM